MMNANEKKVEELPKPKAQPAVEVEKTQKVEKIKPISAAEVAEGSTESAAKEEKSRVEGLFQGRYPGPQWKQGKLREFEQRTDDLKNMDQSMPVSFVLFTAHHHLRSVNRL